VAWTEEPTVGATTTTVAVGAAPAVPVEGEAVPVVAAAAAPKANRKAKPKARSRNKKGGGNKADEGGEGGKTAVHPKALSFTLAISTLPPPGEYGEEESRNPRRVLADNGSILPHTNGGRPEGAAA
jgi:hypothetical protein